MKTYKIHDGNTGRELGTVEARNREDAADLAWMQDISNIDQAIEITCQSSGAKRKPRTRITFETDLYYSSHLKMPRGRGCWAFCLSEDYDRGDYLDRAYWTVGALTFAQAKKQAIKHFPAGAYVTVLP